MRHEYASHSFERNRGALLAQKHMIAIMGGDTNSVRRRRQKTGPHVAGPFELNPRLPVAVMPMVVMPMTMPTDFRRRNLRSILDRSGAGRVGQRQRLGLLSRGGKDQYRTHCSKAQNSRHLH